MRWVAALTLLFAPDLAQACSVCFGGEEQTRMAFIVTTAFLSILPLALVAGLALWLRSRAKALEARQRDPLGGLLIPQAGKRG
jgi:hypothetical protein